MKQVNGLLMAMVVMLISACTVNDAVAQDWWRSPPVDNDQYFYGLGEGYTKQQAQELALNNIAGKLGTTIASEMSRKTQDMSGISADDIRRTIQTQVEDMQLGYYSILRTAEKGSSTRVLVRLDKNKLAADWQRQLKKRKAAILPQIQGGQVTTLTEYLQLKDVLMDAQQADLLEARLSGISAHQPGPSLYQAVVGVLQSSEISIGVRGELPQVNETLEEALAQQDINICRTNCPTWIEHSATVERQQMFGQYVSEIDLKFSVVENGQLLKTKSWRNKVSSVSSSRSADRGAVTSALSNLKERGLWITLGFENLN